MGEKELKEKDMLPSHALPFLKFSFISLMSRNCVAVWLNFVFGKFEQILKLKKCLENNFWAKKSVAFFISFKNFRKQ